MTSRSLLLIFQILAVLAFKSLTVEASKNDVSFGKAALSHIGQDSPPLARALQFSGTDDSTAAEDDDKKSAKEDEDTATDDDTGSVFPLTDDALNGTKSTLLPPEKDQPSSWPATVLVLFLVLAAALLGITAFKNCRRRREYQEVPTTSLIV